MNTAVLQACGAVFNDGFQAMVLPHLLELQVHGCNHYNTSWRHSSKYA